MGLSRIECATGAAEAIEMLDQSSFDLVLMDIQMPDVDGYMATRLIRAKGFSHVKIIACSAHAFEADVKRSHEEGMDGHISKPVVAAELADVIKALFAHGA